MIPTLDELGSATLVHRPADLFSPPALTNFRGCVQVAVDPIAIWNLNFPPLACGETVSGHLFLDGRLFAATGEPVSFQWFPDRIERAATARGLEVTSTTVLAWAAEASIVRFRVRNVDGERRTVEIGLGIQGTVARSTQPWHRAEAPSEAAGGATPDGLSHPPGPLGDEHRSVDRARGALQTTAPSGATTVEGVIPIGPGGPAGTVDLRGITFGVDLAPGDAWEASYVRAVGRTPTEARGLFDRIAADIDAEMDRVQREWAAEIEALFTPGNDRYSGSLPVLETADDDLRRIYHTGVLGVALFKRDSPHSAVGRAYDTLMPRYWATTTFIWDYSLSSLVHALLDPAEMRGQLERWMGLDPHTCYGSDWLTGRPVGVWYSVNDHAMTRLIDQYVRWTGATDWLAAPIAGPGSAGARTVLDHLSGFATGWRALAGGHGLADYGGVNNLLECVTSYVHEVASLNLANVWNLRTAAAHLRATDEVGADAMLAEAAELAGRAWALYRDGDGWFDAQLPDGRRQSVRHCYDLLMALDLLPGDIDERRRAEMVRFFERHLQTATWMRALSPEDPDAITSVRPDHQWNGAYTAWPAVTATGLFRIGRHELASRWLRGLARTMNQGPIGQAHFVEEFAPGEQGGALKASSDWPYINDWACSSGGAWAATILEGVFGVDASEEVLRTGPRLDGFDRDARLVGLRHRGRLYDVDRDGSHASRR